MKERRLQVHTHYIHRLSYSSQEKMVGAFVFIAIAVLLWLFFSSGKSIALFEDYYTLYGRLDKISVVDSNTQIMVGGIAAGRVREVKITKENHIIVTMDVLKRYDTLIREDSIAQLNSFNIGVINQSVIEISVGSPNKKILEDKHVIAVSESINIKKFLVKSLHTIEASFETINHINHLLSLIDNKKLKALLINIDNMISSSDPEAWQNTLENLPIIIRNLKGVSEQIKQANGIPVAISSIDTLVSEIDFAKLDAMSQQLSQLIKAIKPEEVSHVLSNITAATGDIKKISLQIKQGKGLVGRSIYDQTIEKNFAQILLNMNTASSQLDTLLRFLNKELENMPIILKKIEPLINNMDKTIKATNKIWPISSAIDKNDEKKKFTSPELLND